MPGHSPESDLQPSAIYPTGPSAIRVSAQVFPMKPKGSFSSRPPAVEWRLDRTAEPTAPTPSLPAAQLAVNIAAPLSVRSLGAPVPPPVGHAVRVPFPLPAHPGHLPGVQSSLLPTSDITQTDSSCAASQLLHLIACAISGMEGTAGQGVGPSNGARVAPSPSILPNFLTGNAAAPRGYDAEAILRSRSHQAVGKKQRRKDNKKKSQKNDNHHPPQNSGEVKSKRQKKGSKKNQGPKKNQAGDSSGGKSCERA
ncbi:hypothetical protein C7212DRAFT_366958 [Tuber magnatum]|uniref:Uncharacterized protein n=1 Tax=Tuber magnatum TaxID=42249 RepID=A0A317SF59_9PEZI|nr:hypothetical protein C7212DRAFT_366958 [Tuber magnatum]